MTKRFSIEKWTHFMIINKWAIVKKAHFFARAFSLIWSTHWCGQFMATMRQLLNITIADDNSVEHSYFVLYSPNHVNFQFCWRKVLSNKSHSSDYSKLIAPINLQRCIECARALALTNSTVLYLSESKRAHLWMGSSVRYGICDIKTQTHTHRHRSTNKNKLLLFEYTKAKR